jgi:hypothetical protein
MEEKLANSVELTRPLADAVMFIEAIQSTLGPAEAGCAGYGRLDWRLGSR